MNSLPIINTIHLFDQLDQKLIALLKSLDTDEWQLMTLAKEWSVKDVAAHLLDGNIRTLSMLRDRYYSEKSEDIKDYESLVSFLNQLNADWVKAMKRVSPELIIEWLEITGKPYVEYLKSLDPEQPSVFPVKWAGEDQSSNWFHIAREYTEKWHHQQQIRFAVGSESSLLNKTFYSPYLETSMRALPHRYKSISGKEGECIVFTITGEGGSSWYLHYTNEKWQLKLESRHRISCEVTIPDEIAWRIFTKGISQKEALIRSNINGNQELGLPIFTMLAVMA